MEMKPQPDNAFAVYRGFLWFLGVWPLEEKNAFQTFRYVVAATVQATFVLHTATEIYRNNGEISAMVDICLFFASAFLALTKHTYLHIHREKIAENLRFYLKDWSDTKDENFLKIMQTHTKIYKYQHIVYNCVGYAGTTLFLLRTILVNILNKRTLEPGEDFEYQLICQTSYLSPDILASYYSLVMAIQYFQCVYCCTSGACTDCFFFGLVFHLCAQLEILKLDWQKLGTNERNGHSLVSRENQKTKVNELIDRHQELVRLGGNLEASFNSVVLVQLMTSIILICMSGCSILVAMMDTDYVTILISTNCISFMITESFIYGYASDYLLTQSESIVQAVYSSAWYELENCLKKDIIFVMMRAQNPLYITAGKFFYITRNTIIQLLKTTFSYLSVLRLTIEMSHQELA